MKVYKDLVQDVLNNGILKENRTGTKAFTVCGAILKHDLRDGFPLLTTKKMAYKSMAAELEFFIKGIHNKSWLKKRHCKIWNEWAAPDLLEEGLDDASRKKRQLEIDELGPIYGFQWRHFGASIEKPHEGYDQLKHVVETLKQNPSDRRMVVSAWNPPALKQMALPPCHILFHLVVIGGVLNLTWFQRSCDLMLGVPFNLASYALLLKLLALESGLEAGVVCGMLSDVHIYEDHVEGAREQITREPYPLPGVEIHNFTSIFDWSYDETEIVNYQSHPRIHFPIAV